MSYYFRFGYILTILWFGPHSELPSQVKAQDVVPGAERISLYLPSTKAKKVAVVANHASLVGRRHLVDTLISLGVNVVKIFSPEHGFRGLGDAGQHIQNEIDPATGIEIVSLYGDNKEPKKDQISGIELMLFDLQDVGVRFYTYISTLTYVMKACAENNIDLVILDRPNPNGHYIDGPVLQPRFKSFVGMHEVPVVYGMTIGEYGIMVNGEGWNGTSKCRLRVIPVDHYDHTTYYEPVVKPSPNLPNIRSIYLYPSLCFFEGTAVSIGRGTDKPFQVIGHPDYTGSDFQFTPRSVPGLSSNPKLQDHTCSGIDLSQLDVERMRKNPGIQLKYIIDFYKKLPDKKDFFNSYFNLLAGNSELKQQIIQGLSEKEIRKSWEFNLDKFRKIREKYLLYHDFESRIEIRTEDR